MQSDESNAQITNALSGRTVDYVVRNNLQLDIVCTDGHVITLQSDSNYNIQYRFTGVRVILPGVESRTKAGSLG